MNARSNSRLWLSLLLLALALAFFKLSPACAAEPPETPFLRIETGMHTAPIKRIDVDAAERYLVTVSHDKTARVWDLATGELLKVLRVPIGEGNEGKLYAVAISPDGTTVAAAGWTGWDWYGEASIYLLDRSSGRLERRIAGLSNVINDLAWSPDGRYLAAALWKGHGIRVYTTSDFGEVFRDTDYGEASYSVAFDRRGRLLSTSQDGYLRLYDVNFQLIAKVHAPGGEEPFAARFSPNGEQVAVGFADTTAVNVLSGEDLSFLYAPDSSDVDNGSLNTIAWSRNGHILYAGGRYIDSGIVPILSWSQAGLGPATLLSASTDTVMDIRALAEERIVFGASDPALGLFDGEGRKRLEKTPAIVDHRGNYNKFQVSQEGDVVRFGFDTRTTEGGWSRRLAQLDLSEPRLQLDPPLRSTESPLVRIQRRLTELGYDPGPVDGLHGSHTREAIRAFQRDRGLPVNGEVDPAVLHALEVPDLTPPRTTAPSLYITDWDNSYKPRLNGKLLVLDRNEAAVSLTISPDSSRFLLGTHSYLRFYDRYGKELWKTDAPSTTWAVNITPDNRLVLAAFADGTIRWYRLSDGEELLAFFPHADGKRWVLWSPDGFFDAAEGGEVLIGYHLNRGADQAGEFVKVDQLYNLFYRPDLVTKKLADDEAPIREALAKIGDVREVLASGLPPELELVGPMEQQLKRRDFTLEFKIHERGGGVGRIEYRVNGVVKSAVEARPVDLWIPGRQPVQRPLTLENGVNTVTVTAYNAQNKIASEPLTFTAYVDAPLEQPPELYVLAVGVSNYRDRALQLKYAAADARAVAQEVERRGKRLFKAIHVETLLDHEARLADIGAAFLRLSEKMQPSDVLIVYLAGHGTSLNGEYHFIPWDLIYENERTLREQSVDQQRFQSWLAMIPAQKSVMILDTCNAIAFSTLAARSLSEKTAIDKLMRATGRATLAASSELQNALEGYEGHGVFTFALLQGLQGRADRNKNQAIDIDELASYVADEVPRITLKRFGYEQFPMRELHGMNFPIALGE